MNSLRNRGSVHQSVANGNNYLTSLENLVESVSDNPHMLYHITTVTLLSLQKDQNGFREIGPF